MSPASIHNGSCYIDTAAGAAPPSVCPLLPTAMKPARAGPPSRPPQRKQQAFNLQEALILDQPGEDAALVYVPAFLARKLRPHQQQGVQFLYNVWLYSPPNCAHSSSSCRRQFAMVCVQDKVDVHICVGMHMHVTNAWCTLIAAALRHMSQAFAATS